MFGLKKKLETAFAELAASLPPPAELAAELMPAFGPDGPKHGKDLSKSDLAGWILPQLVPRYEHRLSPPSLKALQVVVRMGESGQRLGMELAGILAAVQLLEQAELVYQSGRTEENDLCSATPLGLATQAGGKAAVRQRIEDRAGPVPPIAPPAATSERPPTAQRLQELETLRATGAISDAEHLAKRKQIIDEL